MALTNIVPRSPVKISLLTSNWQAISRLKVYKVGTFRRDSQWDIDQFLCISRGHFHLKEVDDGAKS
jgi:hypothetical protein